MVKVGSIDVWYCWDYLFAETSSGTEGKDRPLTTLSNRTRLTTDWGIFILNLSSTSDFSLHGWIMMMKCVCPVMDVMPWWFCLLLSPLAIHGN